MDKNQEICYACQKPRDFYQHHYDLRMNHTYGVPICNMCREGNHDGWQPHKEERLIEALKQNNLPKPKRNSNGLLPLE
jgi:hypothetical protein